MKTGAVLSLDNIPLFADHLDGVEHAVPDAHADQGQRAVLRKFHVPEHLVSENIDDKESDNRRHRQHLPVHLGIEQTELFSQIDGNLLKSRAVLGTAGGSPASLVRKRRGDRIACRSRIKILECGAPLLLCVALFRILLVFIYKLVRSAGTAFILRVDQADDIFHRRSSEEISRFLDSSVERQLTDLRLGTLCQNDDLVEQMCHAVRRMCDDHDDPALAGDQPQVLHELRRHDAVKSGIGLVQDKERGRCHEFHADRKALLLAAGELGDQLLLPAGQSEGLENRCHALFLLLLGEGCRKTHLGRIHHGITDRVVLAHQVLLGHEADPVLDLPVIPVVVEVPFLNRRLRLLVAGDRIHKGALAGTRSAENENHIAWLDLQVDVLKKGHLPQGYMGASLVDIDAESASLRRISVDKSGSFEHELRVSDLDNVVDADPVARFHGFAVQHDIMCNKLRQRPVPVLIIE